MEEFKFNSESSYSSIGERTTTPITLAFKEDLPKKEPKKGKKVLLTIMSVILIVGISFASGAAGAYIINHMTVPKMVNDYCNSAFEQVSDTFTTSNQNTVSEAVLDIYNSQKNGATLDTGAANDAASTSSAASDRFSPATSSTHDTNATYASVAALTKPTVVEITTEMVSNNSYFQQFVQSGAGSGVIISESGYIITNHHVIDGASKITVKLYDGKEYSATLKGTDSQSDVAVLKIESETALPYAKIGNSDTLIVGEEVLAIGNPLGSLGGSVTNGIISALDRELTIDGQKMLLLQTNAAINPGNSGGGLFNMKGELVALVNAKSAGTGIEGLGFAIPINYAYSIANELLNNGYVSGRPILGISYIAIDDYMDLMRYGVNSYGIYVYDGGETGLQNGDRIVRIGEYEVQSTASLKSAIQSYKVGDTVTITIVRNGKFEEVTATLIEEKPVDNDRIELSTEE